MKKNLCTWVLCLLTLSAAAQQSRQDIRDNHCLSASNYVAYPGPLQAKETPAPKGFEPFYISHYGRHGSRHLIGRGSFDRPYETLSKAEAQGKLTAKGKEVLQKVARLRTVGRLCEGELTVLGGQQHRQIARRMIEHYPQVFAGKTNIYARSTNVHRCILSMANAMTELLNHNQNLVIDMDGTSENKYYLNFEDHVDRLSRNPEEARKALSDFEKRHANYKHLMNSIFNDEQYWHDSLDAGRLNHQLWELASNLQSTEMRHEMSLYDLFTEEEIYDNWLVNNAGWYVNFGHFPLNGGERPFRQKNLLLNIINTADSCVKLDHPGATLRYGHEVCVMPLTCLMELDNFGARIADLEQLDDQGWLNYRIYPMGSNIQLIFYKNKAHKVLVKVLLNENEMHLPVSTDTYPYYDWNEVRAFWLKKLQTYGE